MLLLPNVLVLKARFIMVMIHDCYSVTDVVLFGSCIHKHRKNDFQLNLRPWSDTD